MKITLLEHIRLVQEMGIDLSYAAMGTIDVSSNQSEPKTNVTESIADDLKGEDTDEK